MTAFSIAKKRLHENGNVFARERQYEYPGLGEELFYHRAGIVAQFDRKHQLRFG